MIDITCPVELQDARDKAKEIGPKAAETLEDCIHRYEDDEKKLVRIFKDRGDFNFAISVFTRDGFTGDGNTLTMVWKFWYAGGIIFWPENGTWQIHT